MDNRVQLVTVDFETYYGDGYTLSTMPSEEYIRDPRFEIIGVGVQLPGRTPTWTSAPMAALREKFQRVDWSRTIVLGHNMAEFDSLILTHHLGVRPLGYMCTLAMARALHGGKVSKSLGALAELYGLRKKGTEVVAARNKRRADFTPAELAAYGEYCIGDCEIATDLYHLLKARLPAQEQRYISLFTRMFAEPRLVLDVDVLTEYQQELAAKKVALLLRCGLEQKELRSDAKFAAVLEGLGVDPPRKISKKTGLGAYAFAKTDEGMTALLEHDDPDVQAAAAARVGVKTTIGESRVARFIGIAGRGALPVPLVYGKTHTHRVAGGGKINMQNMGRGSPLRRAVKAPPGKRVVVVDSSNIELRVCHCLSGQMDTVEKLRRGVDLYCDFASVLYGYEVNKKEHPSERQHGKVSMLQLQYQSGARAFKSSARVMGGLTLDMGACQTTVDLFRSRFDMVKAFWAQCQRALSNMHRGKDTYIDQWGLCRTDGSSIMLPNGMALQYFDLRKEESEEYGSQWVYDDKETRRPKKAYGGAVTENLCQALARNVVFEHMLILERKYGRPGSGVVHSAHDETVLLVDEDKAEECLAFAVALMHESPSWWPELPVAAEGGVSTSYGGAK